jgi:Pyruvate/2-oxoacid:ferredoxin oxidoreductase delta subunit
MLAFVNLYRKLFALRITKDPGACHGCGNCRRTCSMDNETIYRERQRKEVYDRDCMGCFKCAEGCAADGSLLVKLGPLRLFSSSRRYAAAKKG